MAPFEWSDPRDLEAALAQVGPAALPKAGGVDLMDRLKERLDVPSRLVNLRRVPGLDGVRDRGGAIELGPLVTLARLADDPVVRARLPALAEAAGHAATPNVRNVATVGGNLLQRPRCWYFRQEAFHCLRKGGPECFARAGRSTYHAILDNDPCAIVHPSDTATALVAYRAVALVAAGRRPEGPAAPTRRELLVEQLFVGPREDPTREHRLLPGELLIGLRVPAPPSGTAAAYVRQGERDSTDWPLGAAAAVLELAGGACRRASIILGAAAPTPWRARRAEALLEGKVVDAQVAAAAAKEALFGATPLTENGYKVQLLETIVRRAILKAAGVA